MSSNLPNFLGAYVLQVPFLSTAHITPTDREFLLDPHNTQILAEITGQCGHILHFEAENIDDDFSLYSPAFRALLHQLHAAGFCYVRLDADGDVVTTLPTFE